MYQVTKTYTRPSTDVDFYSIRGDDSDSITFRSHWAKTYKETGKLIILTEEMSKDNLSYTIMTIWNSQADYDEASNDTIVKQISTNRNAYNSLHGITSSETTTLNL